MFLAKFRDILDQSTISFARIQFSVSLTIIIKQYFLHVPLYMLHNWCNHLIFYIFQSTFEQNEHCTFSLFLGQSNWKQLKPILVIHVRIISISRELNAFLYKECNIIDFVTFPFQDFQIEKIVTSELLFGNRSLKNPYCKNFNSSNE